MKNFKYYRVSSTDQNIARQVEALKDIDGKEFTDKLSGKSFDREEYKNLIEQLRSGDHLYVYSFDRLSRNAIELESEINRLVDLGIAIHFVREQIDFAPNDKQDQIKMLLFRFLTAIAEFERENIKERQAQGIKLAKERNVYKGKKSKFTKADSDKIIELRKTLTVKEIAKTYGCSMRTIYNLIDNNKFN